MHSALALAVHCASHCACSSAAQEAPIEAASQWLVQVPSLWKLH